MTTPISSNTPPSSLSPQVRKDLLDQLKGLNSRYFFWSDPPLTKKLTDLKVEDFTSVLNDFFSQLIEEECIKDPAVFLDRIATVIPYDKLKEVIGEDPFQEAIDQLKNAKLYLVQKSSPGLREHLINVLDAIIIVIDSFVTAFGIANFFKPPENDIQGEFKSNKVISLISLFSMVTTIILPVIGVETGALIIGGFFLFVAGLSLIWPHVKPITTHLPNAKNLSKEIRNSGLGEEDALQVREEYKAKIRINLENEDHVLLVAESGKGKTHLVKQFAKDALEGKYGDKFKEMVFFYINTADIVKIQPSFMGGRNNILDQYSDRMGRFSKRIALVFDEVHNVAGSELAEQFKTFLDKGGKFPHVIGITTPDERKKLESNKPFLRRFNQIDLENTLQDETEAILSNAALTNPSNPILEKGILEYIYKKSDQDAPQPMTALSYLNRCIIQTKKTQMSTTEITIAQKIGKVNSFNIKSAAYRGKSQEKNQTARLEREIKELKKQLAKEKTELKKLHNFKDLLDLTTRQMYSTIDKVCTVSQKNLTSKNKKLLKLFVLLQKFLSPTLEDQIKVTSNNIGIKSIIDRDLVDEVVTKENPKKKTSKTDDRSPHRTPKKSHKKKRKKASSQKRLEFTSDIEW